MRGDADDEWNAVVGDLAGDLPGLGLHAGRDLGATLRLDRRAKLTMRSTGREEWFRRLQWAEELTAADRDDRRATGRAILTPLTRSSLATTEDVALIAAMSDLADIDTLEDATTDSIMDAIDFVEDTGTNESEEST